MCGIRKRESQMRTLNIQVNQKQISPKTTLPATYMSTILRNIFNLLWWWPPKCVRARECVHMCRPSQKYELDKSVTSRESHDWNSKLVICDNSCISTTSMAQFGNIISWKEKGMCRITSHHIVSHSIWIQERKRSKFDLCRRYREKA